MPVNAGKRLLIALAILFPLGMASISHWASTIFYALSGVGLFFLIKNRSIPLHYDRKIVIGFVLFFLTAILSLINADDWPENFRKIDKILGFVLIIPAIFHFYKERIDLSSPFLLGIIGSGPFLVSLAYYQTAIMGYERATGAYHPIVFGDLAMLVAVIGTAALITGVVSGRSVAMVAVSTGSALYASALSSTRGAWIVFPALGILLFFLHHRLDRRKGLILAVCFAAITIFSPLIFPKIGQGIDRLKDDIQLFQDGSDLNTPTGQRLLMWKIALDVWREHPLIGTGIGDFRHEKLKRIEAGETELAHVYNHSHNIYLDALSTTGAIGLLIMVMALFVFPFRFFWRSWKRAEGGSSGFPPLAGMITVVSFAVFGLTEGWLARSPLTMSYLVFILITIGASAAQEVKSGCRAVCDGIER